MRFLANSYDHISEGWTGGVLEHTLGSLAVAKITKGLQAMKKADAEEAPAMKSMKAMKARQGSI